MTLLELRKQIESFSNAQEAFPAVDNLYERLTLAYSKSVGVELAAALKDQDSDQAAFGILKDYLARHWKKINGSALSYTAMPNADVTSLLCAVACWVSAQQNKVQSESTAASAAAASAAGATLTEKTLSTPLQMLMPGIQVESFHPKTDSDQPVFPHLGPLGDGTDVPEIDLKAFLNRHIVSGSIPISLWTLTEIRYEKPLEGHYSYYDPDYGTITHEEAHRVWTHSALLQALSDAIDHYKELSGDKSTLLGQLQELTRLLRFNDAHAGIGTQEDAGTGAYAAIAHFNDYYQKLSEEQKTSIHKDVKEAVEHLLGLSSDTSRTRSAVDIMDTCIGTRREKIEDAMREHEVELAGISLSGKTQASLVGEVRKHVEGIQKQLKDDLDTGLYQGRDTLPISKALLDTYGIEIKIDSMRELQALMRLNEVSLDILLFDETIKVQALAPIENLEALVMFCFDNRPDKLAIFFKALDKDIQAKFLCVRDGLLRLFTPLPEEKVRAITQGLQAQLSAESITLLKQHKDSLDISPSQFRGFLDGCRAEHSNAITTCLNLEAELEVVPSTMRADLIRALKDRLPSLVEHDDLIRISQKLTTEAQIALIKAIKGCLPDLVRDRHDFVDIYSKLTGDAKVNFIESMRERLPGLIRDSHDFRRACSQLVEGRAEFIDAMKDRMPDLVRNSNDFIYFYKELKSEAQANFIEAIKDRFPDLIRRLTDFKKIYQPLEKEAQGDFIKAMKIHLCAWVEDSRDFIFIIDELTTEAQTTFITEMTDDLQPGVIGNVIDFMLICEKLTEEAQLFLLIEIKDRLPDLVRYSCDFIMIDERLFGGAKACFSETIKDHLPNLIENIYDFCMVFCALNTEEQVALLALMKDRVFRLPGDMHDYLCIFEVLHDEAQVAFIEGLAAYLHRDIISSLVMLFEALRGDDQVALITAMKNRLPDLIRNSSQFSLIFQHLEGRARVVLITRMKEHSSLSVLLQNHADFLAICSEPHLEPNVLQALWSTLPKQTLFKLIRGEAWRLSTPITTCFARFLASLPDDRLEALAPSMTLEFFLLAKQAGTHFKRIIDALPESKQIYFALEPWQFRTLLLKKFKGIFEKLASGEEAIRVSHSCLPFFSAQPYPFIVKKEALNHYICYLEGTSERPSEHQQAVLKADPELNDILHAYQQMSGERLGDGLDRTMTLEVAR